MSPRSLCGARFGPPGSNPAWKPQMSSRSLCGARFGPSGSNPAWEVPNEFQEPLWNLIRASWLEPGLESSR